MNAHIVQTLLSVVEDHLRGCRSESRGLLSLEPLGRPRLADTAATLPRVIVASPEGAADVAVARLAAPERPS